LNYAHGIWHDYLYRCLTLLIGRMKNMFELFAEQVKSRNRSNTHLNNVGFKNVIKIFKEKPVCSTQECNLRTSGLN
jgi:hypothetical protein